MWDAIPHQVHCMQSHEAPQTVVIPLLPVQMHSLAPQPKMVPLHPDWQSTAQAPVAEQPRFASRHALFPLQLMVQA